MTTPGDPWLARRQLRAALRKAREAQELTQLLASGALDWSLSKIVRIEAGSVGVSTTDLLALLQLYKVADETETGKLVELARAGRQRPWYHQYQDVISPGFEHYLSYEAAAATILAFHPLTIPGLLQTEPYARAVVEANHPSGIDPLLLDRRLELRRKRQERLELQGRPRVRYILDEAAVHRVVGGPSVMSEQLMRLRDAMDQPEISVGIVPFAAGAHASMTSPFTVVEFEDPKEDALYLEVAPESYTNREDKDVVTDYRVRFDLLSSAALPAEQAAELIETLAEDMRGTAQAREPR